MRTPTITRHCLMLQSLLSRDRHKLAAAPRFRLGFQVHRDIAFPCSRSTSSTHMDPVPGRCAYGPSLRGPFSVGSPERHEADTCDSSSADGVALSRSMSCKSHPKAKCASSCCAKRCLVQSNQSNVEVGMSQRGMHWGAMLRPVVTMQCVNTECFNAVLADSRTGGT